MAKTLPVDEAIRLALHYAIEDRVNYLTAIQSADDLEQVAKTKCEIRSFKKILMRRYGEKSWFEKQTTDKPGDQIIEPFSGSIFEVQEDGSQKYVGKFKPKEPADEAK